MPGVPGFPTAHTIPEEDRGATGIFQAKFSLVFPSGKKKQRKSGKERAFFQEENPEPNVANSLNAQHSRLTSAVTVSW